METTQPTFTKDMVYVMGVVMITLELVLLVVGAALQVLLVVMVHRAKLFHRNFRFILTLTCISYILLVVTRLVIIPPMYAGYYPNKMYQKSLTLSATMQRIQEEAMFVHNSVMVMYSKGFLFVALERCLATYYAKTYERTFTSWIAEAILAGFIVTLSVVVALTHRWELVANHFIAYYLTALGMVSFVVVIGLFNINRIIYARGRVLMLSLSERYQIQENVATCRMLVPVTVMHSITQGISLGAIYWMIVKFENGDYEDFRLPSFTLDLVMAFSVFLMPIMVALFNKHLRNQIKAVFGVRNQVFNDGRESANAVAKVYFNQLDNMWK
ncbi:hypothetical protein QR680_018444 [Steinernema hermaphroditum]|uniref:G protein-coupled receptor n=1 Tax=Steinernema hermaphroditum TaxID=289476 RepID=A0AA39HK86_9BILA|nr:hypothetical protein QR680_018444 [Steinernema hermaphroditum]